MNDNSYVAVVFNRELQFYDFMNSKLLFKLKVSNAQKILLLEQDKILCIIDNNNQIKIYSVLALIDE